MMAVKGFGADTRGAADGANTNLQMQIPRRVAADAGNALVLFAHA
jgi:hypothetical protein